ncbi:regulatory protein RecX [Dehalogenimonas alkenigignens]|uniref:Regulatory protein RecX n=1 Tax=Dehalogenimonas alkenigignens TaxID=1217799 RepID=A0A0W0GGJ2_9CHLR|nr:regulatory protein RecX [Dehalogenimonas alkenigignens]KTB47670.1 hypothetical protein DEALK_05150 [Dehalogenimonas alkenigignens]PVV84060.1 regulatory protein RecX [Dehalogenimonas alkenigignens]
MPDFRRAGKIVRAEAESAASPGLSPAEACYQAALKLLAYRARSEAEMRQRLSRRGFSETEIEAVMNLLKAAGLVDDSAFARAWSEHRASGSPRSAYMIKRELLSRGVDPETAGNALADADDAGAAYRAALPRLSRLKALPADESRRKLADFLRRRGFGWAVIETTLARLEEEGLTSRVDTI